MKYRITLFILLISFFFNSCVIHFKEIGEVFSNPKEFICFSRVCVRQFYGINKINQIKKRNEIKKRKRNAKKHRGNKNNYNNDIEDFSQKIDSVIAKDDTPYKINGLTLSNVDTIIRIVFLNDTAIKFNQDLLLKDINTIEKQRIKQIEIQAYYTEVNKISAKKTNKQRMNDIYICLNKNGIPAYLLKLNSQQENNKSSKNLIELYITLRKKQ